MERIQYIRIVKETPDEAFRRFIALDFETTGLSPAKERIVEIGAVLFPLLLLLSKTPHQLLLKKDV